MVPESSTSSTSPGERPGSDLEPEPAPVLPMAPNRERECDALDAKLEVLVNQRRRIAVQLLAGADEHRLTLDRLAKEVAGVEYDKLAREVTRSEWKRVYIAFLQNHLPKMVDAGVAEYDDGEKIVSLTDRGVESAGDLAALASDPNPRDATDTRAPTLLVGLVGGYALAYVTLGGGPWIAALGMAGLVAVVGYAIARSWPGRDNRSGEDRSNHG